MTDFSDYAESKVIELFLRSGSYTGGTPYIALFESDPTEVTATALTNETAYTDYARQAATFAVDTDGVTSNTAVVSFPANGGAEVTVTHVGVFDASTAGNLLFHTAMTASKAIDTSEILSFAIGSLSITLD